MNCRNIIVDWTRPQSDDYAIRMHLLLKANNPRRNKGVKGLKQLQQRIDYDVVGSIVAGIER